MLINHYGSRLSMAHLYYYEGRIILDCVTPEECNRIVESMRQGELWFRDNRFGINHTSFGLVDAKVPAVIIMFGTGVPIHFVTNDITKTFTEAEPDAELMRYDLGNNGQAVRGAFPALHTRWTKPFLPQNLSRLEDANPTDPEELEVDSDIVLGFPVSGHGSGTPISQGEEVTFTQDFTGFTKEEGNVNKVLAILTKSEDLFGYTKPEEQKLSMGDLFKRSMDAAKEHTAQLKEVYGEQWPKVHNVIYLAKRYTAMMQVDSRADFDEHRFGQKTSRNHLRWMVQELHDNMEQSLTKKNRWLGFIQGMMIAYGYTTVDREREETRDLFNGD